MLATVIDLYDKKLLGIHIRHLKMQMQLVKHLFIIVHFYFSLRNYIISFDKTSFELNFVSKIRCLIRKLTCLSHYITNVIMN